MPAVGRNEDAIRSYIRQQEKEDARLDQLNLWCRHHLRVVLKPGPRQRPRTAASSGSRHNAPGFAGGYLRSAARHLVGQLARASAFLVGSPVARWYALRERGGPTDGMTVTGP